MFVPQFHISGLFPRKRGFISALFVAGFTGCGIVFYVLDRIFEDLGGHRCGSLPLPYLVELYPMLRSSIGAEPRETCIALAFELLKHPPAGPFGGPVFSGWLLEQSSGKDGILLGCMGKRLRCRCCWPRRAAYRWVLISYSIVFCGGLIPFQLWLMPKDPFSVGEVKTRNIASREQGGGLNAEHCDESTIEFTRHTLNNVRLGTNELLSTAKHR